jgi:Dihydrodipicolinate synthetase family
VESNGILWNNDDIVNAMRADLSQKSKLRGIFAPTVTAFHEDGSINPKGTAAFARFLLEQGVDGLTPLGSAGEPVALNLTEQKKLLEAIVDEVSGQIPIYYDPFYSNSANWKARSTSPVRGRDWER